jgi:hypothetical protein
VRHSNHLSHLSQPVVETMMTKMTDEDDEMTTRDDDDDETRRRPLIYKGKLTHYEAKVGEFFSLRFYL